MSQDKERHRDAEFARFVREHRGSLMTSARVLTAGDGHLAEDLVQATLVRLYLSWRRASPHNLLAYARRSLVNAFLDHRRRPFVRRERSTERLPDGPVAASPSDLDPELIAALATLPPRMRAAVVLRYVHGLSVADAADALCCSVGTVKSQAARGLDKLRTQLASHALNKG